MPIVLQTSQAYEILDASLAGANHFEGEMRFNFEWDPAKAASNVAKHGVTFEQAAAVLLDPLTLTHFDQAHSEQEERWFTLGMSSEGRLLAVAHTFRATSPASTTVRLISAREASRNERRQYENEPR